MNVVCKVQLHHKYGLDLNPLDVTSIPMLYALQSGGKYIRCYRCDRQVPKPRPLPNKFRGLRLGRW